MKSFLISFLTLLTVQSAWAGDHLNLEEGLPTQIEDAFPIAKNGREILGYGRYDRTSDGSDRYTLVPQLEYGFAMNWEAEIEAPFYLGPDDKNGSGDIGVSALYNFNTDTLMLPAISIKGGADLPTGTDSAGVDPHIALILTKTLSRSSFFHRLHANIEWIHNTSARDQDRSDRYRAVVGYQVRLDPNNQLIADYVREQLERKNQDSNVLEIGLRHQWDPLTVLAIGMGAGIGETSPEVRATAGLQRSLNLFY